MMDYENYKREIELIIAQNHFEHELYSIVACLLREIIRSNKLSISVRDVSSNRRKNLDKKGTGGNDEFFCYDKDERKWTIQNPGWPDFVLLPYSTEALGENDIRSVVEIKYLDARIEKYNNKDTYQIRGFLNGRWGASKSRLNAKVLYTNGLKWRLISQTGDEWDPLVVLGKFEKGDTVVKNWNEGEWDNLMNKLKDFLKNIAKRDTNDG